MLSKKDWQRVLKREYRQIKVHESDFEGSISCLKILDIKAPLLIHYLHQDIILADKGFTWIQFGFKNKHYWLTVMLNEKNEILQSYFDITQLNNFDDENNPYFFDMFLDVVIPYQQNPYLIDEDELLQAYNESVISKEEYDLAYKVANEIVQYYINNKNEYYQYIDKWIKYFKENEN